MCNLHINCTARKKTFTIVPPPFLSSICRRCLTKKWFFKFVRLAIACKVRKKQLHTDQCKISMSFLETTFPREVVQTRCQYSAVSGSPPKTVAECKMQALNLKVTSGQQNILWNGHTAITSLWFVLTNARDGATVQVCKDIVNKNKYSWECKFASRKKVGHSILMHLLILEG